MSERDWEQAGHAGDGAGRAGGRSARAGGRSEHAGDSAVPESAQRQPLRRLIRGLRSSGPGRAGLALLAILSVTAVAVIIIYPRDFGSAYWGNPAHWADNPRSVPPVWASLFYRDGAFSHRIIARYEPEETETTPRAHLHTWSFPFEYRSDETPTSVIVAMREFTFETRPPIVSGTLIRPDGGEVLLFREVVSGGRPGESAPFVRHAEDPQRIVMRGEGVAGESLAAHYRDRYDLPLDAGRVRNDFEMLIFGRRDGERVEPLHGEYVFRLAVMAADEGDSLTEARVVIGGSVFGVMGTDALGRDLALGLLYGLPIALAIGLATSTVSTVLGTSLGLVSGYTGGRTDLAIQRAADIVANIPVLPLLIFLVFIGGSQLWLILLVLVAFSWPGLTIMVRTMVLQLRQGPEVEAAVSLGASRTRIIIHHVFPHTASYVFAQLVFFAPSAVLAEAGLSFLGLGDPTIPTWGQILEHGFRTGAVFLGYWWWVIPPGLLIVITAVTFMLLALGMESIVDPRLKGARIWRS